LFYGADVAVKALGRIAPRWSRLLTGAAAQMRRSLRQSRATGPSSIVLGATAVIL